MGNSLCCNKSEIVKESGGEEMKLKQQIMGINQQFMKQYLAKQKKAGLFQNFHEVTMKQIINNCQIRFFFGKNFEKQEEAMNFIKQDVVFNKTNLFQLILIKHREFIIQAFSMQEKEDINSYSGISQAISTVTNPHSLSDENQIGQLRNYIENSSSLYIQPEDVSYQLCYLAIHQINYLFLMLRLLIVVPYQQIIRKLFTEDDIPEKETFIQKIIQHYVFARSSPMNQLLPIILTSFYQHEKSIVDPIFESPQLGAQLLPQDNNYPLDDDSFLGYSSLAEDIGIQQKYIEETLQKNEYKDIPYSQTFYLLVQLVQTSKPWKKFKIIEKLNKMIIDMFLFQRTNSQVDKLADTIYAEDSKSEIILYVLQNFCQTYCQIDLKQNLLYSLKFMNDFDGILHPDVKYLYCPSFIRFMTIVEMLVSYNTHNN